MEFKVVESHLTSPILGEKITINSALKQIKEKKYCEKYLGKRKEIYLLGIEFSKVEKNICSFDYA